MWISSWLKESREVRYSKGKTRVRLGAFGERMALGHLKNSGYQIIAKNYRCSRGEVDIIAKDGTQLVFVEVRTRKGSNYGTPEESVDKIKQAKIIEVAQSFLQEAGMEDALWRIDVVAIQLTAGGKLSRIEIVKNAVML